MLLDFLEQSNVKVAIIGAGFAGLRAARHFEQVGIDYVILEGSDRIGGRVYPFEYQNGYLHYGAEYVNGFNNEIYQIVEKYDLLDKHESRTNDLWMLDEGTITVINGKRVDGEKLELWNEFVKSVNEKLYDETATEWQKSVADKIDEHFSNFLEVNSIGEDDREMFKNLCRIFKNYFQTEWSSPAHELGMKNFSTWEDGNTVEDSAVLNEYGFQTILEEFKSRIPKEKICLNTKVINVNYGGIDEVKILLENGDSILFDSVIVTCSLGFLKQHNRKLFSPSLPRHKEEAIGRMGFGSNMKVFLEYEQPWWPSETSTIMISSSKTTGQNSKLTDNLIVFQPSSWVDNMLVVWIAGSGPYEAALKTDDELKELIDDHLKEHLEGQFEVGNISKIYRHDWVDDEFALGSYSYLSPYDNDDIKVIGEPILKGDRPLVCFAGEHTDPEMYQTTVGAAKSGLREAARIHMYYSEKEAADN